MPRLQKQKNKFRALAPLVIAVAVVCWMAAPVALADVMTSEHFRIPADTLSIGGGRGTSDSFIIEDTLGEMATGEDLTSLSFRGCAGYQCFIQSPYISFNLTAGTSWPGRAVGADVALGTLTTGAVKGSDNATINSIFVEAATNAAGGFVVTVRGAYAGLYNPGYTINSATATLTPGTDGFGICIASVDQGDYSPSTLDKVAPYDGSCDTTTNHQVGVVDTATRTILSSDGQLSEGEAEILVKAAVSPVTGGASYTDSLTFVMTATY